MSKTTYLSAKFLNHSLRGVPYTAPSTTYVALFTALPGEAGGGVEVSGGAYIRQPVTFGAPSPDVVSNSVAVTFPTALADWGTIVAYALMDSLTVGNMMYYTTMTTPRLVLTNDQFQFPVGQLQVLED